MSVIHQYDGETKLTANKRRLTMQKYYGIFDACYDTYQKDGLARAKTWIAVRAIETPHEFFTERSGHVYKDRSCDAIKCEVIGMRQVYANDRKRSRCHRFKTQFFIHECDEEGWFLPTKKETEAAKQLIAWRDAKKAEAEAKEKLLETDSEAQTY